VFITDHVLISFNDEEEMASSIVVGCEEGTVNVGDCLGSQVCIGAGPIGE
jgi:hypothetical protein